MIEVVVHGRGGQGAVTLAILLAKAAGLEGKWVQAFPAFGVERRGAPVKAFCRIDNQPIQLRCQVRNPEWRVVLDESLLGLLEQDGAKKVVNGKGGDYNFDATGLALEVLGKPVVNTAMLGYFAKVSGLVGLDAILEALKEVFSGKLLELNQEVVKRAYGAE